MRGITLKFNSNQTTVVGYEIDGCFDGHVEIPNGVTGIGAGAFSRCRGLTTIHLPECLTSVGEWAFGEGISLRSITMASSLTALEKQAFTACPALHEIRVVIYDGNDTPEAILNRIRDLFPRSLRHM